MSSKFVDTDLDKGVLNYSEWVQLWADGKAGFYQADHQQFLDKREDEMFGGQKKSLFLPLCGKTTIIVWMYEHGHTVCGVEIAEQAVRELFEENKIEAEIQDIPNVGKLYKSKDGRIKLYAADLFDMSPSLCGTFDIIWDSRALVAINVADQHLYRDLLLSLMKNDGLYYLYTFEYDPAVWPGPPHPIDCKTVHDLYGEKCNIELLETDDRSGLDMNEPRGSTGESNTTSDVQTSASSQENTQDPASAAIKTSSYLYFRRYKLTLKN